MRKLVMSAALAVATLFTLAVPVHADEIPPDTASVSVASDASVVFSAPQWDLITGVAAPFAIWALTKVGARYKVAVFTTVVVTVLGTIIQRALVLPDGSAIVSAALLFEALGIGGLGQVVYKLFKGGGTKSSMSRAERLLFPNHGVG